MKQVSYNSEFWKIFCMGNVRAEFSLSLTLQDCSSLGLHIDKPGLFQEIYSVLKKDELNGKIKYNPKKGVSYLLNFLNKTNNNKIFIEHLALNTLTNDLPNLKDLIKSDMELNFIFLLESGIFSKGQFAMTINIDGNEPKLFEFNLDKPNQNQIKENLDNKFELISIDFNSYDYLIIDLNEILFFKKDTSLDDLYLFLMAKLSTGINTHIILIFPNHEKFSEDILKNILDLYGVADIIITESNTLMKISYSLGYEIDEKNIDKVFQMDDFKTTNESSIKTKKIILILEDFHKLTVIFKETLTDTVSYLNNFFFDIGLKFDYFKCISSNFELLKNTFYGAFLSKLIQKDSFELSFECGNHAFKKVLELLQNHKCIPDDKEYFVFISKEKTKINLVQEKKTNDKNIKKIVDNQIKRENNFKLDCVQLSKSKKVVVYNPLLDNHCLSFKASPIVRKHLIRMGFMDEKGKMINNELSNISKFKSNENNLMNFIDQELRKTSNIKDFNSNLYLENPQNYSARKTSDNLYGTMEKVRSQSQGPDKLIDLKNKIANDYNSSNHLPIISQNNFKGKFRYTNNNQFFNEEKITNNSSPKNKLQNIYINKPHQANLNYNNEEKSDLVRKKIYPNKKNLNDIYKYQLLNEKDPVENENDKFKNIQNGLLKKPNQKKNDFFK